MQNHSSILDIKKCGTPRLALTLGNFDGVHLGHQQLLDYLKAKTSAAQEALAVMTFVPHPRMILGLAPERFLLTTYQERRHALEQLGVDHLVELPFTRDFSTQGAASFLERHVLSYPALGSIYLGHDFTFGANKEGDAEMVKKACVTRGIRVEVCPKFLAGGLPVASSVVREHLKQGEVQDAHRLLGRPFALKGIVIRGEGRGRKIGVPTANLQIDSDLLIPSGGVYVTESIFRGLSYRSVTNVGFNPTFKEEKILSVESHLIDFSGDLYGEVLEVRFLARLRDERRFANVTELVSQLRRDIDQGRDYRRG